MRDLRKSPYTEDELRVVAYLREIIPDVGAGDDPIGFLLASFEQMRHEWRKATGKI